METLYNSWPDNDKKLPHPGENQIVWWRFMYYNAPEWNALVRDVFFTDSILDKTLVVPSSMAMFSCHICGDANFATKQGLLQHLRVKHKLKQQIATFMVLAFVRRASPNCIRALGLSNT